MTEFHADDFGFFPEQSQRILQCMEHGALNGISVFPNSGDLEHCLALLPKSGLALTIHLNLLQGKCLSPKTEVPLLVNADGVFSVSFSRLLFCGLSGKRDQYKQQLKTELSSQIHALLPFFRNADLPLRLDGHAHWHMIPVVFDALMELIREEELSVSYIRIPAEPVSVYRKNLFRILPFPPVNIVKSHLLRLLAARNRRRWRDALDGMEQKLFLGVLLSGCFDLKRMRAVLPDAERLAEEQCCGLELLAHPGSVREPEDLARVTNRDDYRFFTSPSRQIEAESLMKIRE